MCESDANVHVFSISYDMVTPIYTWASNLPSNNKGLAFFPNDLLNHAVITISNSGLYIIEVFSISNITLVYSYLNSTWNLYQTAISTNGDRSLSVEVNNGLIIYM
jgi:hypothetical protein